MSRCSVVLLCCALASVALTSATPQIPSNLDSLRAAAVREGWPDTDAGFVAARWVHAFSKGEKAMRAVLEEILAPESLKKRSMPERMEGYRDMRERFGPLELVKVVKSTRSELTVSLAGFDMTPREFTFEIQPEKPHKLVRIAYQDFTHQGHGGFSH